MTQLTDQQIADFGRRLDAREAELIREVRSLDDESDPTSAQTALSTTGAPGDPGDEVDRAEHTIRTSIRHAEKERDQQELQEIADAHARVRRGEFGHCVDCDVHIGLARLQALPSAARCILCQERHERSRPAGMPTTSTP